jgi:hypothetical protein
MGTLYVEVYYNNRITILLHRDYSNILNNQSSASCPFSSSYTFILVLSLYKKLEDKEKEVKNKEKIEDKGEKLEDEDEEGLEVFENILDGDLPILTFTSYSFLYSSLRILSSTFHHRNYFQHPINFH